MPEIRNPLRMLEPAARFILQGGPAARCGGRPGFRRRVAGGRPAARIQRASGRRSGLARTNTCSSRPIGAAERVAAELEIALSGLAHSLVDVSDRQVAIALTGPAARDILMPGMSARSRSGGIHGRHVHSHDFRQGGGRFVAAKRRGVPSGSGALLLGLCPGLDAGINTRGIVMTSMQATDVRGAVRFALLAAMVCSGPQLARADQAETPPAPAQARDSRASTRSSSPPSGASRSCRTSASR